MSEVHPGVTDAPPDPAARTRRASHIVLFRHRGAAQADVLTQTFGIKGALFVLDTGRHALGIPPVAKGLKPGRYFADLGVAAVDLSEEQADRLSASDEVAMVAANELRSIPEYTISADGATGLVPAPSSSRLAWPLQVLNLHRPGARRGIGIKVAVLDTGLDLQHADFGHQTSRLVARNFVAGGSAQDGHGHGTHCCGVVAGADPSTAPGGVRYSVAPDCDLMVGKVLDDSGYGYDEDILAAIQWAYESGARVISLSLGSPRRSDAEPSAVYEAIASTLLENNTLLVAAAGNSSRRPTSLAYVQNPAACPSIVSVASVDRSLSVAATSNVSDSRKILDVCAPGVDILSAWPAGQHRVLSGTSMACPHVAGIAALLMEASPTRTAADIRQDLCSPPLVMPLPGSPPNMLHYGQGLARAAP